ncbi:MAG: glycoside hydrolase family 13 protein [Ruminiclostridium sp.]|nr:glycoside hydrolase family 13 protein [Ruminiclostridium sp.]
MNTPIYDSFDLNYKSPFGAIRQYQPSTFTLRFPKDMNVSDPVLVMFRPGEKERFIPLNIVDSTTDYHNTYTCTFNPQHLGLHQYYFFLTIDGNRRYINRSGASLGVLDNGDLFQLTVFDKDMTTPDWVKGGIMYQIFPDRFCRSGIQHENVPSDRYVHENWNDTPFFRPDEKGIIRNNDYFAGDLKGIQSKLPYLQSLGVTCLYLNPIFESHENHRYSTACYEHIDPMLGTDDDFRELCKEAKKYGIDIILDGVFSHTGADSIYFNKFGRYGENVGAYKNPDSPFRNWYCFSRYPFEYESWWGITTLPNVNENNPDYTGYICGDEGILQRWINNGARGWRLDVADELPDDFLDNLNKAVKAKGDDKIIYGEVWEDASNKESYGVRRRYLIGGQLDSVMNYPFKEAIINYVKYSDPVPFRDGVMTILEHYPKPSADTLMNFLSTHDTERILTRLAGEDVGWHDREWQAERYLTDEQYMYGVSLLKCAMVLQFFLPGVPCIYYGDEAGLEGYKDPFNRRCYPWGKENPELIEFTKELSRIRKSTTAFAKGEMKFISCTDKECVFARIDKLNREVAVIFLNKSKYPKVFHLSDYLSPDYANTKKLHDPHNSADGEINLAPFEYGVVVCRI